MNPLLIGGGRIEILNGGISASLTHQWVDLFVKVKDSFHPDVILIVFFLRDGTLLSSMGNFFEPIREEIKMRHERSFVSRQMYRHSFLFRLIQGYRERLQLSKKYSQALKESYLGDQDQTKEWKNAKNNILKIKAIGEEMNAKVALVVFPILFELNDNYPFKDICNVIVQFSSEHGIPTHNLLPAFMGENASNLWISSFDQHPNEKGHKIAADSMLPFLRQLLYSK